MNTILLTLLALAAVGKFHQIHKVFDRFHILGLLGGGTQPWQCPVGPDKIIISIQHESKTSQCTDLGEEGTDLERALPGLEMELPPGLGSEEVLSLFLGLGLSGLL